MRTRDAEPFSDCNRLLPIAADCCRSPATVSYARLGSRICQIFVFVLLLLSPLVHAAEIPESRITRLQAELESARELDSTVEQRRSYKNIVRDAEELIDRYRREPARFRLIAIAFECQKMLFALQESAENRKALLEAAKALQEAPDEYADLRIEPDILLLQLQLADDKSTPDASALAIAKLADRYRDTSGEAKSLMLAAAITFDLGDQILLEAFRKTLAKRFAHLPDVSAFMRERFAADNAVHFRGSYKRADGGEMSFPIGRVYVLCFWSQDTPLLDEKIAEISALQEKLKGELRVYSFNLDNLPDGGKRALQRLKLDWIPLILPGGTENPVYRSAGGSNLFAALVVNAHGQAAIDVAGGRGHGPASRTPLVKRYEAAILYPRQQALLRSLCIGDFLIADDGSPAAAEVARPQRCRITPEEEFALYQKMENQCAEAIAQNGNAPDLWRLHNRRTIALLGLWRGTGDTAYLTRAAATAKTVLAIDHPPGAAIVPQFCLATQALQAEDADAGTVLDSFIDAAGGADAPGIAHAAALMLALEAHSVDQYVKHRDLLVNRYVTDPAAWPVSAFLLDDGTASRLFADALPGKGENLAGPHHIDRCFNTEWTSLDGDKIVLPAADEMARALIFMEDAEDATATALQKSVVDHLASAAAARPLKNLQVIAVFRGEAAKAKALMTKNKWSFTTVALADSEWTTLAPQIGLFAADRVPNILLLRPDGSIILALSGASPEADRAEPFTFRFDSAFRQYDLSLAEHALAAGNYKSYADCLASSFPLKGRARGRYEPEWQEPILHRRKLVWAYMQLQEWEPALAAVTINITDHERDGAAKRDWCGTCYWEPYRHMVRAELLKDLGKDAEAGKARELAEAAMCPAGHDMKPLIAKVREYIESKSKRGVGAETLLAETQETMRKGGQDLFTFKLEHDLMMRAAILENLGKTDAAAVDRRRAEALSWPYPVKPFDPNRLHEAFISRTNQARRHLAAEEWQPALDLLSTNIEYHQADSIRCDSRCEICGPQVRAFQLMAATLKDDLNKPEDAEAALAMAEDAICPKVPVSDTSMFFPMNRLYGGSGPGKSRLNFILAHMKGEGGAYANPQHHAYRLEFAGDLFMRAQALEKLGHTVEAELDRKRAAALAYPYGAAAAAVTGDELPSSYVDVLSVAKDREDK